MSRAWLASSKLTLVVVIAAAVVVALVRLSQVWLDLEIRKD